MKYIKKYLQLRKDLIEIKNIRKRVNLDYSYIGYWFYIKRFIKKYYLVPFVIILFILTYNQMVQDKNIINKLKKLFK